MLHRESFRKKQESQPDDKTVDEITQSERCAIPREIYNNITAIPQMKLSNRKGVQSLDRFIMKFGQLLQLRKRPIAKYKLKYCENGRSLKLQNECAQLQVQGMRDDRCKYFNPK
jgi:hypothetical protein